MGTTVDVRKTGWGTDCEDTRWQEVKVYNDYTGETETEHDYVSELRCNVVTLHAKADYCKTCNRTLVYP